MKKIAAIMMFIAACTTSKAEPKKDPPRNFATESVLKVEENAKCVDQYAGEGETKTHSTLCTLANKVIVYCQTDTINGFNCKPLNGTSQQAPAPTPAPTPAPAKVEPKK